MADERFYAASEWEEGIEQARGADPETAARVLLDRQYGAAVGVARIVRAYDAGEVDAEAAIDHLTDVREVVLAEVDAEAPVAELIEEIQTGLVPVCHGAEEYVLAGPSTGASVEQYVHAAVDAVDEDTGAALGYLVQAATRVADGEDLSGIEPQGLDADLVAKWVNGLQRFAEAFEDPAVTSD